MLLSEALKLWQLSSYDTIQKNYKINDKTPHILVLDPDMAHKDHKILAFNIDKLPKKLIDEIQQYDNELVLKDEPDKAKKIVKAMTGYYKGLTKEQKKNRYKMLIKKFPILKSRIRTYAREGINLDD